VRSVLNEVMQMNTFGIASSCTEEIYHPINKLN
jgi:hypothetical protein